MKRIKHILMAAMVLVMVVMFANANIPPAPAELNNDTGDYWVNYTWSEDTDHPENNNVTDSFNVSMNYAWHNGTATFLDADVGPGGWANITVWAYNATGNGNMSTGSVSDSVQALSAATELPRKCGYIPPPMDLSHLDDIPVKRIQAPGVLPDSFDWRDSGNVTPVKDQDPCGTCWTFGTTSVLESAVLINEGAEYDFSEQSVALCVDRSWIYLYDHSTEPCGAGGWSGLASEVFIKKGSVPESCNPYNTIALNCGGSCVCDDCAPARRVDGYRLVTNNRSDLDAIKTAVYDHGPVTMSFNYTENYKYVNATWGTIYDYYPGPEYANHLVSIVGWDDSVPHPNPSHAGTGAWIVKNSWGTDWGDDGYFYLAYNSSSVTEIAYLEYKDPVPDEELLYWDEAGIVGVGGYGDSGAWMASVFTADYSGNVTHVDFWTTSNNAAYEVYVWDGFFGSELANQTGNCPELGYYSIPLSTAIPIDAGQQFTVGVNVTTPDYGYPIPIEFADTDVDPPIQANVSFIRHNSSSEWTDLADHGENTCLRARMVATFHCTCGDIYVNTSGWWREGGALNGSGTPIQAAVDAANQGETIRVAAGTYDENVDIGTSHLTLVGEGADEVTVTAVNSGDPVFDVAADYVNISGFSVTGASSDAGIYLSERQHCNISDNTASNNDYGIYLYDSSNNTLTSNTISYNTVGVYAEGMEYFLTVEDCEISDNDEGGIGCFVDEYLEVIIVNNDISNNDCSWDDTGTGGGIRLHGTDNTVSIINATIVGNDINNEGYYGGHVRVGYSRDYATANISYVTLTDNYMEGGDSGSIKLHASEYLEVNATNNHFVNITGCCNKIGYADDAVKDLDVTLVGNVFSADDNDDYGLLKILADESITAIVTDNTFEGSSCGGTLRIGWVCDGGPLTAQNVTATIAGNTFEDNSGGAILTEAENDLDVEIYDNYINGTACGGERSAVEVVSSDLIRAEIYNNTITDFGNSGIYVSGDNTDTVHIFENDLSLGDTGIYLECDDCVIESNTIYDNWVGIWLGDSSNYNTLTGNNASDNWAGIWLGAGMMMAEGVGNNTTSDNFGRRSPVSSKDTLADNDASDKGYGVVLDVGAEMMEGTSNNTLTSNNASDNWVGIGLYGSSNNTLTSNNASGNGYGIALEDSSNNTLTSNNAADNSNWDIYIDDSPSSTFTDNTLNGTTVSFTYSGDVSLKGVGLPAADPTGWYSISKFISATDQSAGARLYLNFSYSDSDLDDLVEASLAVWKHNGTAWVKDGWDDGRYLDTTGDVVGANITSFSVFAPMGVPPLHHINVTPTSKMLGISESQDFIARGYAQDGAEISGYFAFEWAISDAYIGSLTRVNDTVTNFTAEHVGRTCITARNGSKTSEVLVTVDAAEPTNETVTNGTATATSGDATVTCNLGDGVTGWINITAIGNATNSFEVNSSKPRLGLGDGDKGVSGVIVNVSEDILAEMENGSTIRIQICYNVTTLTALGIDASTLAIWKYNSTTGWVKQHSTRSGTCVYVNVSHLCTHGLFGSKAASTPSGSSSSGGGSSGTYPPGWLGTPTPTVTATKAPAASTTATDAPPGERVTPAATKTKPAVTKTTTPAAEDTPKKDAPGFTVVFVIAGILAVAYAMMRRRE